MAVTVWAQLQYSLVPVSTISSTLVMYAQRSGILLIHSNNTNIVNTEVSNCEEFGRLIGFTHHITLTNTSVTECSRNGISVLSCTNIAFLNTSVTSSESCVGKTKEVIGNSVSHYGIFLTNVSTAVLYKTRVMCYEDNGITISVAFNITIRESVDSLCRDGSGPPIVCVHWKAVLTRERSCSKPFWTPSYPIRTFLYSMIPPK